MQLSTREAEAVLRKIGVTLRHSSHHVRGFVQIDGVAVLPVHYSHGNKQLPGGVPHKFRRSLLLSVEEFRQLGKCTLSKDEYFAIVRGRLTTGEDLEI